MPRFVKKPVEVEAHCWDGSAGSATPIISWVLQNGGNARFRCEDPKTCQNRDHYIVVDTLEGPISAQPGDWIIRGVAGEFYPRKPEIFEATYDALGDEANVHPQSFEKVGEFCGMDIYLWPSNGITLISPTPQRFEKAEEAPELFPGTREELDDLVDGALGKKE